MNRRLLMIVAGLGVTALVLIGVILSKLHSEQPDLRTTPKEVVKETPPVAAPPVARPTDPKPAPTAPRPEPVPAPEKPVENPPCPEPKKPVALHNYFKDRTPDEVLPDGTHVYHNYPFEAKQPDGTFKTIPVTISVKPVPAVPILESEAGGKKDR